jgi:hypothetical protein
LPYKPFRRIDRAAFEDRLLCRIIDIDGENARTRNQPQLNPPFSVPFAASSQ